MLAGARAAEVLFANCNEAAAKGTLPDAIRCIEFGIGSGDFGLQLLDRLQELCEANGADFYERLTWYATDDSPEVLFEVFANDIYGRHATRVQLGHIDVLEPTQLILHDTREQIDLKPGFQGMFLNFVLSALPAEVWCHQPEGEDHWQGAMVRLAIEDWAAFEPLCPYTKEALLEMANEPNVENLEALSEIYTLLQPEFTLGAAEPADIPRIAELQAMANDLGTTASGTWILDSGVALSGLTALMAMLNDHGYLFIRDFGPGTAEDANQSHCYRNFGPVTAFPVNFWQIDRHFSEAANGATANTVTNEAVEPRCRVLAKETLPDTFGALEAAFGLERLQTLVNAIEAANEQAADPQKYLEKIREAIDIEPMNWTLISEAATYALTEVEDPEAAVELAVRAVTMNPAYAAEAWKVLGDVKFWIHRDLDLAAEAFQNAVASDPTDPTAHLGLHQVFAARKDHAGALIAAASAVAEDKDGRFQDHALQVLKASIDELVNFHDIKQKYNVENFAHDS